MALLKPAGAGQIVGERRHGTAVQLQRAARISAGREQELRTAERSVKLCLVDRHAPAGEEASRTRERASPLAFVPAVQLRPPSIERKQPLVEAR